jgi:rare lipoprotein A
VTLSPHCSRKRPASHNNTINQGGRQVVRDIMESVLNLKLTGFFIAATQIVSINIPGATAVAQTGIASVYSTESGSRTASGAKLNPGALTAAHRSLPFGSKVRVTNRRNGRSIVVTVNDRGPFVRGRIIDVTPAGARALGFSGVAQVSVERE